MEKTTKLTNSKRRLADVNKQRYENFQKIIKQFKLK